MFNDPNKAYMQQQLERRTAHLPEHVRVLLNAQEPHEALAWLDNHDDGRAFVEASPDPNAVQITDADVQQSTAAKRAGYDVTPESIARRRLQGRS